MQLYIATSSISTACMESAYLGTKFSTSILNLLYVLNLVYSWINTGDFGQEAFF